MLLKLRGKIRFEEIENLTPELEELAVLTEIKTQVAGPILFELDINPASSELHRMKLLCNGKSVEVPFEFFNEIQKDISGQNNPILKLIKEKLEKGSYK